jgi:hypothetical protein
MPGASPPLVIKAIRFISDIPKLPYIEEQKDTPIDHLVMGDYQL